MLDSILTRSASSRTGPSLEDHRLTAMLWFLYPWRPPPLLSKARRKQHRHVIINGKLKKKNTTDSHMKNYIIKTKNVKTRRWKEKGGKDIFDEEFDATSRLVGEPALLNLSVRTLTAHFLIS